MNKIPYLLIFNYSVLAVTLLLTGCNSNITQRYSQTGTDGIAIEIENGAIVVSAGNHNLPLTPLAVEWELDDIPECMESNGTLSPVQHEQTRDGRNLVWIVAEVPAGERKIFVPSEQTDCHFSTFQWETVRTDQYRLLIDGLPSIEYVYPVYDPDQRDETLKPFHHVYSPDGSRLITKGPGGNYPHHRGIYYGYNDIRFNGHEINTWGVRGNSLEHGRFGTEWTGPVFGGHEVIIDWKDPDGIVFAEELRKVKVFRRPVRGGGIFLIDVEATLTSLEGMVELDGDFHHGGLQFRAPQYVYENQEQTRYLRADKWSEHPSDQELNDTEWHVDAPWNALQIFVEGVPVTIGYLTHPKNPRGGQMSERLYGRFGEYIPGLAIDKGESLTLRYRFLVRNGHEVDREEINREYAVYTDSCK